MRDKSNYIASGICAALFILLIILMKNVDVQAIGPAGTSVGFATLNGIMRDAIGEHSFFYVLTIIIAALAIMVMCFFFLLGLLQLIKYKDIWKVDYCILALGGLYAIMILLYLFFTKVAINYRPIIEAGQLLPEASFPSSHTMVVCVVFGSAMNVLPLYLKKQNQKTLTQVICVVLSLLMVIGRMMSGVHWFTDIIGGVLISLALLFAFEGVLHDWKYIFGRRGRK